MRLLIQSTDKVKLRARDLGDIQDSGDNKTVSFVEELNLSSIPAPLADIAHNPGNRLTTKKTAEFVLNNGTWALQSIN